MLFVFLMNTHSLLHSFTPSLLHKHPRTHTHTLTHSHTHTLTLSCTHSLTCTHVHTRAHVRTQDVPWPSDLQTLRVSATSEFGDVVLADASLEVFEALAADATGVEAFAHEPTNDQIVFTGRIAGLASYTCYVVDVAFDSGAVGTGPSLRIPRVCTLASVPVQPEPPVIDGVDADGQLRVTWEMPARLQAPLVAFELVANVDEEAEVLGAIVGRARPTDEEMLLDAASLQVLPGNATFNLRMRIVNTMGTSPLSDLARDPNGTYLVFAGAKRLV